ncbi:hypothetical protein [Paraglaciecola polaris]|uniref:hypothetical protein n=1 Tax=Paraglaciecola polaris TaxID=222814 RepID=UPI00129B8854|nr:hypothetical protein [Paraglaciecola polaris]
MLQHLELTKLLLSKDGPQILTLRALFNHAMSIAKDVQGCRCLIEKRLEQKESEFITHATKLVSDALSTQIQGLDYVQFSVLPKLNKSNKELTIKFEMLENTLVKRFTGKDALNNALKYVSTLTPDAFASFYDVGSLSSIESRKLFEKEIRTYIEKRFDDHKCLADVWVISAKDVPHHNRHLFAKKFRAKDRYPIQISLHGGMAKRTSFKDLKLSESRYLLEFMQSGLHRAINKVYQSDNMLLSAVRDFEVNFNRNKSLHANYDVKVHYSQGIPSQQFTVNHQSAVKRRPALLLDEEEFSFANNKDNYTHIFLYVWSAFESRLFNRNICKFGWASVLINDHMDHKTIYKYMRRAVEIRLRDYSGNYGFALKKAELTALTEPAAKDRIEVQQLKTIEQAFKTCDQWNNPTISSISNATELLLCNAPIAHAYLCGLLAQYPAIQLRDIDKCSRMLKVK